MKSAVDPLRNARIRAAAGDAIARLIHQHGETVSWRVISEGFIFNGERIRFANKTVGIFKPAQLTDGAALSLRTSNPSRPGRARSYADQSIGEGLFHYKLQGDDPHNHHNRLLWKAKELGIPLIYFLGIADALYVPVYPVRVEAVDSGLMEAVLSAAPVGFGGDASSFVEDPAVRRYRTSEVRTRLHQLRFRQQVLAAYGNRCALSRFPVVRLLDAAHIIRDSDPEGAPVVQNGICLSKLHHTAYDANLLGIDPAGVVHVRKDLLDAVDGPLLEQGLKNLRGSRMEFPADSRLRPDRTFLEKRFAEFESETT